jgi:hypothetical protein
MDYLATLRTGRDIRNALNHIPSTLNETYVGILQRIPASDREIAREALMWLCFSIRPLKLQELADAVVLNESDSTIDEDCRLNRPEVLLDICQGLVGFNNDGLTLAHDSIRSFLTSQWIRDSPVAIFALDVSSSHKKMMRKSITYLSLEEFSKGYVSSIQLL